MSVLQRYLGKFPITGSEQDFSINDGGGADAVQLTAGDYFLHGFTGEGTDQLLEHMQAQIRAVGAPYGSATVTISAAGIVTIDFATGGTNIAITWTDSALQTLLGFTGTQSGAESYTATNQARYIWHPSLSYADFPGADDYTGIVLPTSTTKISISKDGSTVATEGHELNQGGYAYEMLPKEDVVTDASTVWESFQKFWSDVIHKGRRVRMFHDRTSLGSSDYKQGRILPPGADILGGGAITVGDISQYIEESDPGYKGLWNVKFRYKED